MERLTKRYKNTNKLAYVRASRVDYYTQHSVQEWIDHLGSLGTHSLTHLHLFITLFSSQVQLIMVKGIVYSSIWQGCLVQ